MPTLEPIEIAEPTGGPAALASPDGAAPRAILYVPVPQGVPHSEQTTTLDGRTFLLRFDWIQRAARWHLGILQADGTPIVMGLPLVNGVDILRPHRSDPRVPQGSFAVIDLSGKDREPSLENFGEDIVLLYAVAVDASS